MILSETVKVLEHKLERAKRAGNGLCMAPDLLTDAQLIDAVRSATSLLRDYAALHPVVELPPIQEVHTHTFDEPVEVREDQILRLRYTLGPEGITDVETIVEDRPLPRPGEVWRRKADEGYCGLDYRFLRSAKDEGDDVFYVFEVVGADQSFIIDREEFTADVWMRTHQPE